MSINKAFNLALEFYQKGNSQQALAVCEKIARKHPNNVKVLHFLGVLYQQHQNYESSIKYLRRAIHFDQENFEGFYNLGRVLEKTGEYDEAIEYYLKALQLNPTFLDTYINLGNAFQKKGQTDSAITYYQKAIQLSPNSAAAYYNLAIALQDKNRFDGAIACYRKVLLLSPSNIDACYNLGHIFQEKGQLDESILYYQKAIQLDPNFVLAYNNLGNVFQEKGQLDESILYYQKAIQLNPNFVLAYNNLGNVFQEKGQHDKAILHYRKSIELDPNYAEAHWNLSLTLLLIGNFTQGWREYEWRWKITQMRDFSKPHSYPQPLWNGYDISNLTILLHTEQGFGDAIQFIRYAPLVAKKGARVFVSCRRELAALLKTVEGVDQVIVYGEQLPEFDLHCPLLSLPAIFETMADTIPARVPYFTVDPVLVQKWRSKIQHDSSKCKIGLVWSGNPRYPKDYKRSASLETFSPLGQFDEITFYSLQKGDAAQQAKKPPKRMNLIDLTNEIHDFSDTAALIENFDLIISVDTAAGHLAGALGKPVWILLPFAPDWRWMLNREDSPWYPTMRLFREPAPGDWEPVIKRIANELQKKFVEMKS